MEEADTLVCITFIEDPEDEEGFVIVPVEEERTPNDEGTDFPLAASDAILHDFAALCLVSGS